jgi:hypothetical protein
VSYPRYFQKLLPNLALAVLVSILSIARLPQKAIAQTQPSFSDVESDDWYRVYVEALVDKGFLAGYPDGTYRADRVATRDEYASAVAKAFDPAARREQKDFVDVPNSHWAYQAIQTAYRGGLFDFHPKEDANIPLFRTGIAATRGEVLTSMEAGLDLQPQDIDVLTFTCPSEKGQVKVTFRIQDRPKGGISRADMAVFIYQALVKQGKISSITPPPPSKNIQRDCSPQAEEVS